MPFYMLDRQLYSLCAQRFPNMKLKCIFCTTHMTCVSFNTCNSLFVVRCQLNCFMKSSTQSGQSLQFFVVRMNFCVNNDILRCTSTTFFPFWLFFALFSIVIYIFHLLPLYSQLYCIYKCQRITIYPVFFHCLYFDFSFHSNNCACLVKIIPNLSGWSVLTFFYHKN